MRFFFSESHTHKMTFFFLTKQYIFIKMHIISDNRVGTNRLPTTLMLFAMLIDDIILIIKLLKYIFIPKEKKEM